MTNESSQEFADKIAIISTVVSTEIIEIINDRMPRNPIMQKIIASEVLNHYNQSTTITKLS